MPRTGCEHAALAGDFSNESLQQEPPMNALVPNQDAMQDPTKQVPQPKFRKQPQSAPGLASDMDPKPDHDEQSYRGFARLEGRGALITGADSGIASQKSRFTTGEIYGVTGGNHLPR